MGRKQLRASSSSRAQGVSSPRSAALGMCAAIVAGVQKHAGVSELERDEGARPRTPEPRAARSSQCRPRRGRAGRKGQEGGGRKSEPVRPKSGLTPAQRRAKVLEFCPTSLPPLPTSVGWSWAGGGHCPRLDPEAMNVSAASELTHPLIPWAGGSTALATCLLTGAS